MQLLVHLISHVTFASGLSVKGNTHTIKICFKFLFMLLLWINMSERIPDRLRKRHLKGTEPERDFLELVTERGISLKKLCVFCAKTREGDRVQGFGALLRSHL
jgi:hypothetical protein